MLVSGEMTSGKEKDSLLRSMRNSSGRNVERKERKDKEKREERIQWRFQSKGEKERH